MSGQFGSVDFIFCKRKTSTLALSIKSSKRIRSRRIIQFETEPAAISGSRAYLNMAGKVISSETMEPEQ
jgi:hypothetical protein